MSGKTADTGVGPGNSTPGTYALVLRSPARASLQVGHWGQLEIGRGYYVYVGSAFGPGGLRARVGRHCRDNKALRWHIDYLRQATRPVTVWYSLDAQRLEHRWADALATLPGAQAIAGFGCSDCACLSHLYRFSQKPTLEAFAAKAPGKVEACRCGQLSGA